MSNNWTNIGSYIQEYTKGITPKYVQQSNTIVLNQKCIRDNQIDYSFAQFVDDNQNVREDKYIRIGDILINSTGQGTAGRIAFVESLPNDKKVTIDSHILILRCEDIITANLIRYSLFSFEKTLMTFIDGSSGQGEFDKIRLFGTKIKLPTNNNILIVKLLSSIDKKIKLNNKIISELEQMAKELYDYWFVQFDFPDTNGKPYRSSGGKMVYNQTLKCEIPEGWKVDIIGDYAKVNSGFAFKSEWWKESGVPVIKILNITENCKIDFNGCSFVDNDKIEVARKFIAKPFDVVIAMTGATIGKYAIIPDNKLTILINQRVGLFDLGENPIDKLPYLINLLKQSYVRETIISIASGCAQPNISGEDIENIIRIKPNDDYVNIFNSDTKDIYKKSLNLQRQNQELATLRDWLLPMLMNGQVAVSGDSNHETNETSNAKVIEFIENSDQRFELWLSNQGAAARGEIDKATLREIFDAMDEDDK